MERGEVVKRGREGVRLNNCDFVFVVEKSWEGEVEVESREKVWSEGGFRIEEEGWRSHLLRGKEKVGGRGMVDALEG